MAADAEIQKVISRLRNLCARREYCTADVREKALTALDGDAGAAEKAVAALVADKYVDDSRYCAAYAREKSAISGWGAVKIRHILSLKGLAKSDIDYGLSEIDPAASSSRLGKLLAVKAKPLGDDPQKKMKLLRFALGRGYGYDEVKPVVDRLCQMETSAD